METTTAQANELERRIDLSIAIADVEKEMDQRLKRMGKNMKMPGFRPGKVPFSIVRQQHGDQARHEVLSEELDRVFGETVSAQKMRVAGYPRIEAKSTDSTTHLEFAAIFEVYPEFVSADMSTAEVERPEEVLRGYYAQPQRLGEVEGLVIESNVVEWVLGKAKVTDKPAVFDELMGQKQ